MAYDGSHFHLGANTHKVPMLLHKQNREKLVTMLKKKSVPAKSVVLMQGGESVCLNDSDRELLFRQESYFQFLFGVSEPDCFGVVDVETCRSVLFIPRLPDAYAVWMGKIEKPSFFQKKYEVDEVKFVDELKDYLKGAGVETLLIMKGTNCDSGSVHKGATFPGIEEFKVNTDLLYTDLCECRVIKSELELDVLRYASKISSRAHVEMMRRCKPKMMEYQIEAIFLYEVYSRGGMRNPCYTCIAASGDNAATLHYGHAGAPNNRELQDGDMILADMGAEYHGYCSDITRTFPVNGKFTPLQRSVYETVLAAQTAVIKALKPGVSWVDMQKLAYRTMAGELVKHGFLQGSVEDILKENIMAALQPHGLGHFMGIDTHDVGGYLPGHPERPTVPGLKNIRTARILQPGMVVTVEPGCYFIAATLEPALADPKKAKFFNIEKVRSCMKFGGVRIENDLVITKDGCEDMTFVPRTVEEIESVMAGGEWHIA